MFNNLWVDKYKPNTLSEVSGNKEIINYLKKKKHDKLIDNFIFSGISGIGKTSTAICLLKDIYKDKYYDNVLEINASDDLRKIDVVKNQVNTFLQKKIKNKVVIFDEADSMTKQVQHTLRSIIDTANNNSKFILICNNLPNIIESLQSRCLIIKFKSLSYDDIYSKIKFILNNENIVIKEEIIQKIIKSCNGDLRSVINKLQPICYNGNSNNLKIEDIDNILNIPHEKIINKILNLCIDKKLIEAFNELYKLSSMGYSVIDVIETFNNNSLDLNIDEKIKIKYQKLISSYQIRIADGFTDYIQLTGLISDLYNVT